MSKLSDLKEILIKIVIGEVFTHSNMLSSLMTKLV